MEVIFKLHEFKHAGERVNSLTKTGWVNLKSIRNPTAYVCGTLVVGESATRDDPNIAPPPTLKLHTRLYGHALGKL